MDNELVTVLIPCYNVEKYVLRSIASVQNQTYKNLEILLIDDGSTDNTYSLLESIALSDSRLKLIKNEKNIGLIRTLNKGIELSTGEYIARFDADDLITPTRIASQLNVMENYPEIDLVTSYASYITPKGRYHSFAETFLGTENGSAKFLALFETPLLHAGLLIKSKVLRENKYEELVLAKHIEDHFLFSKLLFNNIKVAVLTNASNRYFYTRNFQSVSGQNKFLQNENIITRSYYLLTTYLQIDIQPAIHKRILLRNVEEWSYSNLLIAIKEFKKIKVLYLTKEESTLSENSRYEINVWESQRILKMIVLTFLNGSFIDSFFCILILLKNLDVFKYKRTYLSMMNRTIGKINTFLHSS
jgi:glycosyltransferase involved in cell wall biosynthesis